MLTKGTHPHSAPSEPSQYDLHVQRLSQYHARALLYEDRLIDEGGGVGLMPRIHAVFSSRQTFFGQTTPVLHG